MSAVWTVEQRRCLDALGFALYRSARADAAQAMASAATDPLLRALLRAATRDPARTDTDAWSRAMRIPSLIELRTDPAAKRALWPRLRAARRGRGHA